MRDNDTMAAASSAASSSSSGSASTSSGAADLLTPVLLSAFAGSASALGGLVVLCLRDQPSDGAIALVLAFAAGVMSVVSVVDLFLPAAQAGARAAAAAAFFLGLGAAGTHYARRMLVLPEPEELAVALRGALGDALLGGALGPGAGGAAAARERERERERERKRGGGGDDANALGSLVGSDGSGSGGGGGGGASVVEVLGGAAPSSLRIAAPSPSRGGIGGGGGGGGGGGLGATFADEALEGSSSASSPSAAAAGAPAGALSPRARRQQTWRLGLLLALILSVHNLPEGIAVGVGSVKDRGFGLVLCAAIFLHNIAEGFVIAVPILAATGDRRFAFAITALSGLAEPLGAGLGVLVVRSFFGAAGAAAMEPALNAVLCAVGGVMLHVSATELIPQALRCGSRARVAAGFAAGAAVILVTGSAVSAAGG